ncbi:MAG: NUDIX hydrolase [Cyclobacteriaceae bacterium]
MEKEIIEFVKRTQALAKTGLSYAKDPYDIERYEELRDSSNDMLTRLVTMPLKDVKRQFANLDTYPTPKVDVRGLVLKEGKILLIQERTDQKWAMPGGWCDIGYSPSENIVKEVREESGLKVKVSRLLSVWDKAKHDHPADINYVYKLNFLCETSDYTLRPGHEAMKADYFDIDNLPPLSLMRNTENQIRKLVALANSDEFDFD